MVKIKPLEGTKLPEISIYPHEGGITEILLDKTFPKSILNKGPSLKHQPKADTFVKSNPISVGVDEEHLSPVSRTPMKDVQDFFIPSEGNITHVHVD